MLFTLFAIIEITEVYKFINLHLYYWFILLLYYYCCYYCCYLVGVIEPTWYRCFVAVIVRASKRGLDDGNSSCVI